MFPLTRPARQVAATAALLALTVAPTGYVALTAWRVNRPSHAREVEAEVGRRLGMRVTIGSVRYPKPGEVVYRGVVLRQGEPGGRGGKGDEVEAGRAESVRLRRGDRELTLEARGLRLRGESPRLVMAQVGALLQRSGGPGAGPLATGYERVSLNAPDLTLDLGAGVAPYRLREVVGDFRADPLTPTLRASYRVVGPGSSTRCEMTLTRDRQAEPVRTTLSLQTMEGLPLPARVLDPFFDTGAWLGPDALVEGALTLEQEGAGDWEAGFQGHLLDVDLNVLVHRRFSSHRLSGRARLAVDSARWAERPGQGYGWVEARGELTAGPGTIGLGLLQALSNEMHFRKGPKVGRIASAGQVDLDFRALAFRFAMTSDGEIRLTGALGNETEPDAVIASAAAPLAYAPQGAGNVRGLIKTLFPVTEINHATMVPLTERSRLLLCLPIGPDVPSKPLGGN
jgi:hypothetical protein